MSIERALISIAPDSTHPRLAEGERFLTLKQFHTLIKHHNLRGSLRTIYRWLDIPKEHLPRDVRTLLNNSPSVWFIELDATSLNSPAHVIPLRYLREDVQAQAATLALTYMEPDMALRTVRSLRTRLTKMQEDLCHLEQYMEAIHGKDVTDVHGTARHTLTA